MNEERRKMIVREIEHWRRSKLLPDQYCDFLLNLYTDPDDRPTSAAGRSTDSIVGKAFTAAQGATGKQWFLTFGTFTLISFVVLYFSRFHPVLQIGVLAAFVAAFLWIGKRVRTRHEAGGLALTGVGMLLLLGGSLHVLELHGLTLWGWRAAVLGGCAVFWIVYGIALRIPILHLCGWLAGLLVYGWMLTMLAGEPAWYDIQLFWLPLAILFGWCSWFIHRWSKRVSAVLFVTCALAWFMPELHTVLLVENLVMLQLQLLVKIAIGGGLLFALRKQWMMWVV